MQLGYAPNFMQRLKFYALHKFNTLVERGQFAYDNLPRIYCIAFLEKTILPTKSYHTIAHLRSELDELVDDQMTFVTVELAKFGKSVTAIETDLDKLIYTMNSMDIARIEKAQVLGALYKAPLYQQQDKLWRLLLKHQHEVRKHFADWGGDLYLDEAEGYARVVELAVDEEVRDQLPTLIEKRPLNYPTTLLAVLLRKQLIEHQRFSGENMLRVNRTDLYEQLSNFLNSGQTDEAKVRDRAEESINTLERYGLLRKLGSEGDEYEVRRVLNSFVDGEFIAEFEEKLRQHALTYFKQTDEHDAD